MLSILPLLLIAGAPAAAPSAAAPASVAAKATPVTIEYYYRIRWGAMDEFRALYAKNHQPILDEMKRLGFITRIETTTPFTHMAGGTRWDLRVAITYRGAEDAVGDGTGYDAAAEAVGARLFPDLANFKAEEARRFALVEEHWDVIVNSEE
ncbi:hypothetical protein ASE06_00385 [Sphingopyxis sp. Root214]|uniref:hypothetical protein n=1 Tax=unclassified Sphingopyxis TaxID=2614943 RepID=UPI0006FB6057|nr:MULTISPECIES: hypothetical protein [unclassified Sphingopyxis]KQZ69328.1 hypothetical protein ASD73_20060 [Sphingopyxis sp. Root154]KRC10730.1 hypothetical protein ASE06_00385 [Sphingopyxis sp. Root214]